MTPADMPLTVIQSDRDPEWHGLMRRFHRINPRTEECATCGEPFTYMPSRQHPRRLYCGRLCRRRAASDYKGRVA